MINKVLQPKYTINEINCILSKIGFIKQTNHLESTLFRLFRYFFMWVPIIVAVKYLFFIFIYHYQFNQISQYQLSLPFINDFTFFMPKIRIHANLMFFVGLINTSILQLIHYKLYTNGGQQLHCMKLFEMLSGKIKHHKLDEHIVMMSWSLSKGNLISI